MQPNDAHDITQQVWMAVFRRINHFEPGSFRGWLSKITTNRIKDFWRRNGRPQNADGVGGSDHLRKLHELQDFAASFESDEARVALVHEAVKFLKGLAQFDEKTIRVFERLMACDRPTSAEVAAEFQMTPNAVRRCKIRVLTCFHDQFGDLLGELGDDNVGT